MPQVRLTPEQAAELWFLSASSIITITENDVGYIWYEYAEETDWNRWLRGYCEGLYNAYHQVYLNWFTVAVVDILTHALTEHEQAATLPNVERKEAS